MVILSVGLLLIIVLNYNNDVALVREISGGYTDIVALLYNHGAIIPLMKAMIQTWVSDVI